MAKCIYLKPLKVREKILRYKENIVRGWSGLFVLSDNPVLMKFIYDAGLGSKNPQGFGMVEVVRHDRVNL
jgi:CRISPR-associated endoribonuclease Cas6